MFFPIRLLGQFAFDVNKLGLGVKEVIETKDRHNRIA